MVILPLLVIELKATPNGNPSNDFYWGQKFSSLNVVQYNTTSRPVVIHLQIYIALPENLINLATCFGMPFQEVPKFPFSVFDNLWLPGQYSIMIE